MKRTIYLYSKNNYTIEYSVVGEGTLVLMFHGGHSNCQETFGYDELLENGYSFITPSRIGYGKSRASDDSLESACAAYVDVLNHLNIEKVHVIGISAGGASRIYFAAHYPERVKHAAIGSIERMAEGKG